MPCIVDPLLIKKIKYNDGEIVPFECDNCNILYYKNKSKWRDVSVNNRKTFCSKKCENMYVGNSRGTIYKQCTNCSITIRVTRSHQQKYKNHFCTQSCAAHFNNKIREAMNDSVRQKISKALRRFHNNRPPKPPVTCSCKFCGNLFEVPFNKTRLMCSVACRKKNMSLMASQRLKLNNKRYQLGRNPSYMERTFTQWLISKGVKRSLHGFLTEVHFYNREVNKNGFCDFVFPTLRLIIELDGNHHERRRDLDKLRDLYLQSRGWRVKRITHKEYRRKTRLKEIEDDISHLKIW